MKQVMNATIIRGNGECMAYMNGVVSQEMARLNEQHKKEMEAMSNELSAVKHRRNELLKERMNSANVVKKPSLMSRIKDGLIITWCKMWGIGEALGLWTLENIEEDEKK